MPRQLQGVQQGDRPTRAEHPWREVGRRLVRPRGGKAGQVSQLGQQGALQQVKHRGDLERGVGSVQRGCQPVADHGHRVGTGEVLVQEPRVGGVDGVVEHGLCGRFDGVSVVGRCMFAEGQTHRGREGRHQLLR